MVEHELPRSRELFSLRQSLFALIIFGRAEDSATKAPTLQHRAAGRNTKPGRFLTPIIIRNHRDEATGDVRRRWSQPAGIERDELRLSPATARARTGKNRHQSRR